MLFLLFFFSHRYSKCRHDRKPSRVSSRREGWQGKAGWSRGGMYDGFISYRLKGTDGGKHPVVAMATEPAPCELDVYLNARELRDVIFTPLFCPPSRSLTAAPTTPLLESALGDNVILSFSPWYPPSSPAPPPPRHGMAARTSSSTNNVSSLAVRRINWIPGELIAAEATAENGN